MKRVAGLLVMAGLLGCAAVPQVNRHELSPASPLPADSQPLHEQFEHMSAALRGKQFGDLIFKENTSVYLITPALDQLSLLLTASEEQFSSAEVEARSNRIRRLHDGFLIFSLDLRLPFYPGWSQAEMLDFLKRELVVTLENGEDVVRPDRRIFNFIERFHEPSPSIDELEVSVPLRVYFRRRQGDRLLLHAGTRRLVLKLRLLHEPPYTIGFWDEKFYQGFEWRIVSGAPVPSPQTTAK